jgi:zinc protease
LQVERLDNGLTVIFERVPNKVVTLDAWINAGSANEDNELSGISHFLEHMMFKGTPRYGVGQLDETIMNVGGVWNAGTSKDFTHYYVTVAAPFFSTALDAISDMLQNAMIDPAEFDKERQVILEEYRRKQDDPGGVLYDELYELCYEKGPYKRSVIGTFESISQMDRDTMFDYCQRYYAPDNMVLMVIGDIDFGKSLPMIRDAFAGFSRKARPLPDHNPSTAFRAGVSKPMRMDVNMAYLGMAFPAPPISQHTEVFALDFAATILCDGRSSRAYRRLREDLKLVYSISGGYPMHRRESLFYVMATLESRNADSARQEIVSVFRNLASHPPGPEEMAKARRGLRNGFLFGTETNTGRSGTIGYYYTMTGGTEFCEHYLENLDKVRAEDVTAVAEKVFSSEPCSVMLEPQSPTQEGAANA